MENDKSCIIVGNAQMSDLMGSKIDSYDEVVRMNRFRISGYEDIVGTKCTTWVLNNKLSWRTDYYEKNRRKNKANALVLTIKEKGEDTLRRYKKKYNNFDYVIKEPTYNWRPTTGILAIEHFIEQYGHVTIAGFDFGKSVHYWGNEGPSDAPNQRHGWDEEEELTNKLFREGKLSYLESL